MFPSSLLEQIQKQFPHLELDSFVQAQKLSAVTSIRKNGLKITSSFQDEQKVPWCTSAHYVAQRPIFSKDPLWHAGAYYVQEASSMFLQHALQQCVDTSKPLHVLDLCAAPGGKSTLVADVLSHDSLLVCNEVIGTRVNILAENICKWGRANTWVSNSDPKQFANCPHFFDVLLVDAPCSGSGLFRKDAKAIDEWSLANVHLCTERQQRILHDALPALKPGGLLIYMTCSFSEAENEGMLDHLINTNELESIACKVPIEWGITTTQSPQHQVEGYRFFSHLLQGEGFFLACLRKKENVVEHINYVQSTSNYKNYLAEVSPFYHMENKVLLEENENIFAIPASIAHNVAYLQKRIKLVRKGTLLGQIVKGQLLPAHDAAMSIDAVTSNVIPLDEVQALRYVAKVDASLPDNVSKGWNLISYQNIPLGFIKHMGNRYNNYYPVNWRLRNI
jgi:16S rRNA C967 or C1407 C5-methylase (RsmB/RsmF family)/NOL1/NOP2/fmu family ribosome biogenesis protein